MVDIKKQVAETCSKKPFRPFKRNSPTDPKPLNAISNAKLDGDEEEVLNEEQMDDEEEAELQGMWDFILPNEEIKKHYLLLLEVEINLTHPNQIQNRKLQCHLPEIKS